MVSSKGLCFGDKKSEALLALDEEGPPAAVQLFGDDPERMATAAVLAMKAHPDVIDINMGCPAPKIAGNACGSALMRDPELCRRIVAAVCAAVPVPVTAKIRKGYARNQVNAVEVALACEAGGRRRGCGGMAAPATRCTRRLWIGRSSARSRRPCISRLSATGMSIPPRPPQPFTKRRDAIS